VEDVKKSMHYYRHGILLVSFAHIIHVHAPLNKSIAALYGKHLSR
jgi:hypothetical protein